MNDLLRTLRTICEQLSEYVMRATPSTPEETVQLNEIRLRRDRLDTDILELQERRFVSAQIDLSLATSDMRTVQQQLEVVANKIENVKKGIETTNKVLEIAASVAAKVATFVV